MFVRIENGNINDQWTSQKCRNAKNYCNSFYEAPFKDS